jgi:hypothetical protein
VRKLRDYFPAAEGLRGLGRAWCGGLLAAAGDPARAARLIRAQVACALKFARRPDIVGKTTAILKDQARMCTATLKSSAPLLIMFSKRDYPAPVSQLNDLVAMSSNTRHGASLSSPRAAEDRSRVPLRERHFHRHMA